MVRDRIITILKEGIQDTIPAEQLGMLAERIYRDCVYPEIQQGICEAMVLFCRRHGVEVKE